MTMKLKKAVVYYGAQKYDIHGLPEIYVSDEEVIQAIRNCVSCSSGIVIWKTAKRGRSSKPNTLRIFSGSGISVVYSD